MNKIKDEDISFVVQGPVQGGGGRRQISGITAQCLQSIRKYFPGSTIILSTWKGQDLKGLLFDKLVESEDPGSNTIFVNDKPVILNNNRQLHSTHQGLKEVVTKYAVKIRSDNLISGRGFVALFEKYSNCKREKEFSFFKSRLITSSTFFIQSHYGDPVYFHKSDIFDFGLTEDLLKVWTNKGIGKLNFYPQKGYKSRPPATEQFLTLNWLSLLLNKQLHINNKTNSDADLGPLFWKQFLANNIIAEVPEKIGLDVTERFYKRGNLSLEYDLNDWKVLSKLRKITIDRKRIERSLKVSIGTILRKVNHFFCH